MCYLSAEPYNQNNRRAASSVLRMGQTLQRRPRESETDCNKIYLMYNKTATT